MAPLSDFRVPCSISLQLHFAPFLEREALEDGRAVGCGTGWRQPELGVLRSNPRAALVAAAQQK